MARFFRFQVRYSKKEVILKNKKPFDKLVCGTVAILVTTSDNNLPNESSLLKEWAKTHNFTDSFIVGIFEFKNKQDFQQWRK